MSNDGAVPQIRVEPETQRVIDNCVRSGDKVAFCYEIVEDEKRRRDVLLRSLSVAGLTVEDKVMAFGAIARSHATEKKAKDWLTNSRR
jgi:hypothetical protein